MKRYLILIVFIVALFVLGSCSALSGSSNTEEKFIEAHPEDIISFVSSSDSVLLGRIGYPLSPQEVTRPGIFNPYWREDEDVAGKKIIKFDGVSLVADYVCSMRLTYRKICYDYYQCEKTDQIEYYYCFLLDRETDRIIGYEKTYIGADPGYETPMSDEELMAKAVEELSKFTDVDYYKEKRIENSSIGPIERKNIWFYNKAGDVEFADSSWVKLTKGGVVLQVMAYPEPETINACKFNELNVGEFDAAVEEQLKKDYPDYHLDDETRLLDVRYTGMKVQHRCITSDDDGKPVIAYYVTPQMKYDLTYKGNAAKTTADNGGELHKEGISEPPVYLIVYIE